VPRGGAARSARLAHNQEVRGSNPLPATKKKVLAVARTFFFGIINSMSNLKLSHNAARNLATVGMGLVIITVLLIGVFFIDKSHRDSKLSAYAQSLEVPPQCRKSVDEYIAGQFTPMDEILRRDYTCSQNNITVSQAMTFFTSKGFAAQHSTLKNVYVLQKDGYYYSVKLLAVGESDESIRTQENASSAELALVALKTYTGFRSY
jgi:hypothetical protein